MGRRNDVGNGENTFFKRRGWVWGDTVQSLTPSPTHRAILFMMLNHADWETGEYFTSQKTIAEKTGYCRKTIHSAIKEFVRLRIIIPVPRDKASHNYEVDTFRLNYDNDCIGQDISVKKDLNSYLGKGLN